MSIRCLDCINFKCRIVNQKNFSRHDQFYDSVNIHNNIKKGNEITIYYCKAGKLQREVYICYTTVKKLIQEKCKAYDKSRTNSFS